ncbi:MAG: 30S ribosome-binding factor RbfA [Firmicutes bacterium]|jgi:ribosome-binding factor A|nr:30S ribosome-binding factor RbfA [Bacillota bacterium]
MTEQRAYRVAEEIKREISDIIRHDVKDPRVTGMISVTGVDITRDLSHAKVFVSIFGSDEEQQITLAALTKATGFIRSEIGKRIRLRHTPELTFQLDRSISYGAYINDVLRKIERKDNIE